jgi:alpha-amylase
MGVLMQAFYWDCPNSQPQSWWEYLKYNIPRLNYQGFTAIWLPPVSKAYPALSMGYAPYDYYDLGEYNQKGSTNTWFGSKEQLLALIKAIHDNKMQVYADLVINHNSGADEQEKNPIDGSVRWTKFNPASGKFKRDWSCFHPSYYETWDNQTFGDMPDLCHRKPDVYTELIKYAKWLLDDIGFDGFRYDFVLGYGGWMARAIQELRTLKNGKPEKPFGVGECWERMRTIDDWLDETNSWSDNPVGAFDFPLRDKLKDLCDVYGFSLKNLASGGTLMTDRPNSAVTFVENHDIVRSNPIINDKMLAYAFILTHEGYPCIFWQDYFNWGLGLEGQKSGIAELVKIHEIYAGGGTSILYVDDNLYIMQRNGLSNQKGLVFVLNNRSDGWNGANVKTLWNNTKFVAAAWRGKNDLNSPQNVSTNDAGNGDFWAPPRGYAVYVPLY